MVVYLDKPLVLKMGIKENFRVVLCNHPEGFETRMGEIPPGVKFLSPRAKNLDFVVLFVVNKKDLRKQFSRLASRLAPKGMLWVAWPKKASKVSTDLSQHVVQQVGLDAGLVDVKICAIDATWSGLKFMFRKAEIQKIEKDTMVTLSKEMKSLSKESAISFFQQAEDMWIKPELEKRKKNDQLPENFVISACLIKLPKDSDPIVQFNDEIGWKMKLQLSKPRKMEKGDLLYINEIISIDKVWAPEVNGKRVAFVYLYPTGEPKTFEVLFDFTPNYPEEFPKSKADQWLLEGAVLDSLRKILVENVIGIYQKFKDLLRSVGLWVIPALLPYPQSEITRMIENNDMNGAINLLKEYCNAEFIDGLVNKWWTSREFNHRKELIEQSLSAHKDRKFHLSIHALIPQLEGIITDWISTKVHEKEVPWRLESKAKKFKDITLQGLPSTFTYNKIVESTIDFIYDGPVLKSFKKWNEEIDRSFPNRHVVGHGKYDDAIYTEENSIKLILLLDTVYYLISSAESKNNKKT